MSYLHASVVYVQCTICHLNMYFDRKMFVCAFFIFSFFSYSVVGVSGDAAEMQIMNKLDMNLEHKSYENEQSSQQITTVNKEADELSRKLKKLVDKAVFQIKEELAKSPSAPIPVTSAPIPITSAPFLTNIPVNAPSYAYAGPIYLPVLYPPSQMNVDKIMPIQNQPASSQQTQRKDTNLLVKNFQRFLTLSHNMLVKVESHPPCDSYEEVSRTCWIEKQLGQQLKLRPKFYDMQDKELDLEDLDVRWYKHYKIYKSTEIREKEITDDFEESNVKFGNSRGVLNLKPLKDDDMDFSSFVLTVRLNPSSIDGDTAVLAKMKYRIRILPIDMGFVDDGERLSIDVKNYITLPKEEVILDWFIERGNEQMKLPSNMDVSENGQILTVKEFQNRRLSTVIVCSIYDKKTGIFRAQRRFKFPKFNRQSVNKKNIEKPKE